VLAQLAPSWPGLCIVARPDYLEQLKDDFERKKAMVLGESGFMLLAVIISAFMLHRVTWLERRSYREMRQFWSRVTHELKTPITGIKAFLQTLQAHEFSRAELMPLLGLALREVERQEMLAENLLVGQRLERGGPGLTQRIFAPGPFLREFIEGHRIFLPDSNIGLSAECPDSVEVRADPDAVRVILENLADNALKYGGADPHIHWALRCAGSKVEISLKDSGMGFSPGQAEEMFEAYQRLSEHHTSGRHGTGMGLYISRQLARRMGGDLTASSEGPGKGAKFTLTLRLA
jgi:signal transduction histidine kinase